MKKTLNFEKPVDIPIGAGSRLKFEVLKHLIQFSEKEGEGFQEKTESAV